MSQKTMTPYSYAEYIMKRKVDSQFCVTLDLANLVVRNGQRQHLNAAGR